MANPNCPHCSGTGWKIVERAGLSGAVRCDCGESERPERLYTGAQIPTNYRNASFDNFVIPGDNPTAKKHLGTALMQVDRKSTRLNSSHT